jgi:hypothetical protein
MEMQKGVKLNTREQILEWTLLGLAVVFVVLCVIGIINQSKGINGDDILVPSFFFSCGLFFLSFGLNGLVKGQLIEKWTPYILYASIKAFARLFINKKADTANNAWKVVFGTMAILFGAVCVLTAIYDLQKHI